MRLAARSLIAQRQVQLVVPSIVKRDVGKLSHARGAGGVPLVAQFSSGARKIVIVVVQIIINGVAGLWLWVKIHILEEWNLCIRLCRQGSLTVCML